MASMMGVSSNLQALSLEVSRKVSFVAFQASVSPWLCYRVQLPPLVKSGCSCRLRRLQRVAAISTPNNVVNEKALKSLEFDEDLDSDFASDGVEDGDDGDDDYGSDAFEQKGSDDENLAISRLDLDSSIVEALNRRGITHLFPIQRAVLVPALEGRDIIGRAKTGTGKTLAFGIPIVQKVMEENKRAGPFIQRRSRRLPRVLVLAPTRELAKQVEKEFKESAPSLSTVCIYGGVSYATQQNALSRGVDVVVGTPGRIIDLVESKSLLLSEVQFLVLDEADQMLAVGFEEPVEIILEQLSAERQSMLFSATMPGWVQKLARKYLNDPLTIDLVGDADDKLPEGIKLYAVSTAPSISSKRSILGDLITVYAKGGKSIVFTRTKRDADDVATALSKELTCEALHGDISQYQRERTLSKFREGKFLTLVATDVAARGLDIPNVDLIIHYELPVDSEAFVHRSGRTGRAGKEGVAILMYTTSERRKLKFLENDVSCKFEFVHPPQPKEVLQSSSQHVAKTLEGVHPELINMFLPMAEKLLEQEGNNVMAAALACLSGFSQPPSSRSLLTLEKGWTTLQIAKDSTNIMTGRAFTPRDARGVLSSIWPVAADQVGKIKMITDRKVQGAVFDLPEDVARDLLKKQSVPGFSISEISQLPELEEEDEYFRGRERGGSLQGFRGRGGSLQGFRGRGGGRSSSGRGRSRFGGNSYFDDSDDDDDDWPVARKSRQSGYDDGRKSSRSSFGSSSDRNFRGACYRCGKTGHKAADCPSC